MNKKEVLDMTSKILTSDNQIWRSICMKIIILFKTFTSDRIDIFHMVESFDFIDPFKNFIIDYQCCFEHKK